MRGMIILLLACVFVFVGCEGDLENRGRAPDVTVASLNILHGLPCPRDTANCRLADRIELLFNGFRRADVPIL